MGASIIPVIHNVSSVQRLVDMARLAYSLGLDLLVATKVYGAAAQHGIPEAMRLAFKQGRGLLVLPDLEDAIELLSPTEVILVSLEHANEEFDPLNPPVKNGKILVVFNGGEPDFTPQEIRLGKPLYIREVESRLGPIAEASVVLYGFLRGLRGGTRDT